MRTTNQWVTARLQFRMIMATFFSERAGRSSLNDGPPPVDVQPSHLPKGGEVQLLIHLHHYSDWTPLPERSSSSDAMGRPASSTGSSNGPVLRSFKWHPGVLDGRSPSRPVGPRMLDACRRPPGRDRRGEDPEDDGRGPPRRDWRRDTKARGRLADEQPRSGGRQRTRSPPDGEVHRHGGEAPAGRGRHILRSPVRRRNRQPQRRDDEGWERRRSISPTGRDRSQDRALLPALQHQPGSPSGPRALPSRAAPAPTSFPDPLLDSFPSLRQDGCWSDIGLLQATRDPMLLELVSAPVPRGDRSWASPLAEGGARESPASLVYVPASKAWTPPQTGSGDRRLLASDVSDSAPAVTTGGAVLGLAALPVTDPGPEGKVAGLAAQTSPVENIAAPLQLLALDEGNGPENNTPQTTQEAAVQTQSVTDGRQLLNELFPAVPPPALATPACTRKEPRGRSISVEPTRRSLRQAACKSVVPVSQRATHRLIRQLNLTGPSECIGDEAVQKYTAMFNGPLAPKTIEALRAATRLAEGHLAQAATALASAEVAAQVDAAAF
jgi:hypothetical protein